MGYGSCGHRSSNFYPRPPRGGRPARRRKLPSGQTFLSTPSARRATMQTSDHAAGTDNFYPRPPRGGRLLVPNIFPTQFMISIHALREEGDAARAGSLWTTSHFYPRPPRGGRPVDTITKAIAWKFLSTPSARRATGTSTARSCRRCYFYPRPPRGGRPI